MKTYVCRKLFLYYKLTELGFRPFKICPDKYNPEHLIWLYTDCPEIQQAVKDYYASYNGNG